MSLDLRSAVTGGRPKREVNSNNSRVLLLFSTLLVMTFGRDHLSQTVPKLVALVVAAAATGVALGRPFAARDVDPLGRAERVLVGALLFVGLILTGGVIVQAFADPGSPLWVTAIAAYAILGLAAGLSLVRRLPQLRWAFTIFLLAHATMTVVFLLSAPAAIDVEVFLHDGAVALLHGHNPYSMTFPNIYPPELSQLFYGPGVVDNGRVTYGFPYLPISLLVAIPGQLLGDVRYSQLIAMVVTAVVLSRLASDRVGRAAAVLGVASPAAIPVITGAWTEPTLVALLACLVLALQRRRYAFFAVLLGLFFVSKQYVVIATPVIWLIRQWLTRRVILISLGLAAAVTVPFFLIDPPLFWKAIVEFQLVQPFRADSVSLLVSSVNTFGWPPPWTYGVLPLVGGGLTAILLALRAPRTPAAFAASVGLTLLVTILLSKQAFMNYYFIVSGAFLIAAVAWPTRQPPLPEQDSWPPPISS